MSGDDRTDALRRLNETEREFLRLLGCGHTAKSIAAAEGVTVAAVNERFRSARRKTGLGSSREIARLILAQENRDEFIDLAEAPAPVSDLPRPGARRRASSQRWRLPMAAAVLLAAALLAQQTAEPPERPLPPDAAAAFAQSAQSPDLNTLRMFVTAGPVDPNWSPEMEAALSRAYRQATGSAADFEITCSRDLCEVIGVTRSGLSGTEISHLLSAVQAPEIEALLGAADLENVVLSFSTGGNPITDQGSASLVIVSYWRRGG